MATRDDFWLLLNDLASLLRTEFSKRDQARQLRAAFDQFPPNVQEQLCGSLSAVREALDRFDESVGPKCEEVKRRA